MPPHLDTDITITDLWLNEPDGKSFKWDGLSTAQIVDSTQNINSELYATIKNTQEISFECKCKLSRNFEYYMLIGANKRLIRRARRWYEKLRRKELKTHTHIENKTRAAADKALFGSNNSKKKRWLYVFKIEGVDVHV